jgi:hypothetical protein
MTKKDYTKYNVEGLGENLNKRKLVFTIVKDWIEKNSPSFDELQKAFPDEVQGSKGVVRKEAEVKDPKRYNVKEPLKIKNGAHVVVCNQWGDNIGDFIDLAKDLGYLISSIKQANQIYEADLTEISIYTTAEDLGENIDILVHLSDGKQKQFIQEVIEFVNAHKEYYWLIPAIKCYLNNWSDKIDDEGLNCSINGLMVSGNDLLFNPYQEYRLYYDWREEMFGADENEEEPTPFFQTIMDTFYDFYSYDDLIELSEEEFTIFINMSKTILFCTIAKECENNIRTDELTSLLMKINFDSLPKVNDEIIGGDLSLEIVEDTLFALGIDVDEHKNEDELWQGIYLINFEDVAQELLNNDVFDIDFIR